MNAANRNRVIDAFILIAGIILAAALRYSLVDFKSVDYFDYTKGWYNTIKEYGFSAFSQDFSNYNLPYLYLLYLIARSFPNLPGLIATKLPSLLADFICAWLAYRIVRLKHSNTPFPWFAAFAILFAPTVVLNSAFWGQADALYTTALIACLYYLLIKKHTLALLLFGLSLAFKAQALFLAPLLFGLFLRKEISLWKLLYAPLVVLLSLVPAWIAGRPLLDLLLIYPAQAGQYQQLTMHAPSIFSWLPDSGRFYPYLYPAGLILATAAALFYSISIYKSENHITPALLIELALFSAILMPFILPKMHERYFYPADVICIIFVFYFPRYFYFPVLMNVVSFFAYQPTLFGSEPVSISLLAAGILILLIVLARDLVIKLLLPRPKTEKDQTQ
jgi:Gpi18-like mannosyltransferase